MRMVVTPVPNAPLLVPKPPTVSCDAVQAVMVGGNVVVVILSPPGGEIVVGTGDDVVFVGVAAVGDVEAVQPARTRPTTTVATAMNLCITLALLSTRSGCHLPPTAVTVRALMVGNPREVSGAQSRRQVALSRSRHRCHPE